SRWLRSLWRNRRDTGNGCPGQPGTAILRISTRTADLLLAADEGLHAGAALLVGELHGRGLQEVRRRRDDRAADAAVLGDLGGADRVDDDAGRVGGVPDLELVLEAQR